ncbi:hypothetical protein [Calidifontibacillus oryziterrae]|uniref:hypothetical protein n=1 Tax=Calidifontibacillus oryziterrae TaxID=1191699 RepID=UPI0002FBC656|nr:hypothetical protein [Calidifontibacillus oryziterrae]
MQITSAAAYQVFGIPALKNRRSVILQITSAAAYQVFGTPALENRRSVIFK